MIGPARAHRTRIMASLQRSNLITGALDELVLNPVQNSPFVLDLIELAERHAIAPFTRREVVKVMDDARAAGWEARAESDENLYQLILTEPEDMAAQARKEGVRL